MLHYFSDSFELVLEASAKSTTEDLFYVGILAVLADNTYTCAASYFVITRFTSVAYPRAAGSPALRCNMPIAKALVAFHDTIPDLHLT